MDGQGSRDMEIRKLGVAATVAAAMLCLCAGWSRAAEPDAQIWI